MRLDEPHIIIDHTLTTKPIELQAVVQSIVQIAVWACENAAYLLQVLPEESVAAPRVRRIGNLITEGLTIEESW